MTSKRLFYSILVLTGIAGMAGLGAWDLYQIRHNALVTNERWVRRASSLVTSERQALTRWLGRFPVDSATFRDIANSRDDVAGIYMYDQKAHQSSSWIRPRLREMFEKPDPRIAVLVLQTLEKQKGQSGPIVFQKHKPYFTVSRPLDRNRVLIAFIEASHIWEMLNQEAELWHTRVSVYDYDRNLLFSSFDGILPPASLERTMQRVHNKETSGTVLLPPRLAANWLVTFHYTPETDWVFVITQRAVWVYAPLLFFLLCLTGISLLAQIPFRAASAANREEIIGALGSYAVRVDGYVRGREGVLPDPPSKLKELMPITATVRWLMPLWKKAEAFPRELALERKLLSLLVESLPEGILFFNANGGMQLSNELGRVFLGLEQEGREPRMVNGVQIPRGFLEPYLEPVFTGNQPNSGKEVEVAWADGKHLYRLWVERVEAEGEKTGGFIVVVRDITFRKQWEYVQEQVLSGITHDLRGPLSAVLGYLDLMKRQIGDNAAPKVQEYLKMAREAGVRLSQMVTDILDVVRFEQGKIDMSVEAIPVSDLFQRLKNTFSVIAEQKKVHLKIAILGDAALHTNADRKLIERVLDNLVGNAIKFTPPDGQITVTAKPERDRVLFDVVDTGRGIPREAQSRIFDKFQQVRPGDRSAGYGLGLAVAKFIIEAHKGEIRVESEVGVGSRFAFWLPNTPLASNDADVVGMDPNRIMMPPRDPKAA
jgi:signal transduction histidine kinase